MEGRLSVLPPKCREEARLQAEAISIGLGLVGLFLATKETYDLPGPRVAITVPTDGPYFAGDEIGLTELWKPRTSSCSCRVSVAKSRAKKKVITRPVFFPTSCRREVPLLQAPSRSKTSQVARSKARQRQILRQGQKLLGRPGSPTFDRDGAYSVPCGAYASSPARPTHKMSSFRTSRVT
jgi:hypothetical protein